MVNDDAKLQAGLLVANAVMHEVKDYVDELVGGIQIIRY